MSKLKPSFRRPSDLAFSIFLFSLGSAIGLSANADSWNAPDHGYLIQINPPANGIAQQASSQSTLSGRVTFVPSPLDPEETVSDLSSAIGQDGVSIRLYFPDYSNEVTSKASFQPGNGYTSFTYKTDALDPVNLNTFIVQVIHQSGDYLALQQTQAKIDQRVAILNQLIQSLQSSTTKPDQNRLAALTATRDQLKALSSKIAVKLSSANQVLSERKFPLQVANSVSSPSSSLMLMGGFKLEHSFDIGSAIQGESTVAHSKVTRVYISNGTSKFYWITDFSWQGQNIKSVGPQQLAVGDSLSNDTSIKNADPSALNQLSVAVNRTNNGNSQNRKLYGSLALDEPVAVDNTPPHWATSTPVGDLGYVKSVSAFNGTLLDDFGLIDRSTLSAQIVGNSVSGQAIHQDWTSYFTSSVPNQGQSLLVSGDPVNASSLPEGTYQVTLSAADLAGNSSPNWSTRFVLDHTPPVVQIGYNSGDADGQLTRSPGFSLSLTALDYSPVSATVLLNGLPIFSQSNQTHLSQNVALTLAEGPNTIEVDAVDAAGNASAPITITRVLDTTPPLLSVSQPKDSAVYTALDIPISGTSNEALSSATVNSQPLTLSSDQKSFTGTFTAAAEGSVPIQIVATDLAGNPATVSVNPIVILRVLNPNLLSVVPNPDNTSVTVKGARGAVRPNDAVTISSSIFNRTSLTAEADGSFSAKLSAFHSATVTAYDAGLARSESADITFGATNILLSGQVRDNSDNPLPGATVSFASGVASPVVTDATGTFSFTQPASGDQILIIDGTTIPVASPPAPQRKFSRTSISISIGLSQSNVLQRPIYLTAIPLDGSATVVDSTAGGVVIHKDAPGVQLNIPAGAAIFPDGSSSGPVYMSTISTNVTTLQPMKFAMPEKVVALEPSGMHFSEPVDLTLPNDNHLPAGVDLVIMSMNSQKGIWEIDGAAKVSTDGNSITTKPGMGITHFSTVYAAPIGPTVLPIGAQDVPGADTFNGTMSTSVKLPTYKLLGKDFGPTLLYKSAWAKPNAVVSNLFDIPRHEISIDRDDQFRITVRAPICIVFCWGDKLIDFYADAATRGQAWYVPDFITAQFQAATLSTQPYTFTGVPNRAKLSFATDLIDPDTHQYLPTGVYPYQAKYEVHLNQMVVGTRTVTKWNTVQTDPQVSQEAIDETRKIEQVFPQDVGGPLFVQNETQSSAGRGWRIGGVSKIANPTSSRVMMEEGDGSISSYILDSTVETLVDGNAEGLDLTAGVELNQWPNSTFLSSGRGAFVTRNLQAGASSNSTFAQNYSISGRISGYGSTPGLRTRSGFLWQHTDTINYCGATSFTYGMPSTPQGFLTLPDGRKLVTDFNRNLIYLSDGSSTAPYAGSFSGTPTFTAFNQGYGVYDSLNSQIIGFMGAYGLNYSNDFGYRQVVCLPGDFCDDLAPSGWSVAYRPNRACPGFPQSAGNFPVPGFNGDGPLSSSLSHPYGITAGPRSNTAVFADYGNNRVRLLDLSAGTISTIAGNSNYNSTQDMGDGSQAVNASVSHPRGVAYDTVGNLYISTENGFVRKVDTTGVITTIMGSTTPNLVDEAQALSMSLSSPTGLVVDNQNGYLYVSDTGHHRVIRLNFQTMIATVVAGNGNPSDSVNGQPALGAGLSNPGVLGLDSNNNLLIADSGNNKIKRVNFQFGNQGVLAFLKNGGNNKGVRKDANGNWIPDLQRNADGSWTRNFRNGSIEQFDANGRQLYAADRVGNTVSFTYDANGNLIQMTDPTGRATTFTYYGTVLASVTDPAGRTTKLSVDAGNNLSQVTFPDGSTRRFTYDASGLMVSEQNQVGAKTYYTYNPYSRLIATTRDDGTGVQLSDSTSQTVASPSQQNTLTPVGTEAGGALDQVADPNGNNIQIAQNALGYVTTIKDASGGVTTIQRDSSGRPLKIMRPDGTSNTYQYDLDYGDLLSQTDTATGITTSQVFDSYGNQISSTSGRGLTSTTVMNSSGLAQSSTDPRGGIVSFTYNSLGQVVTSTNPLSQVSAATYDGVGNLVKFTDTGGRSTSKSYDVAGNIVSSTDGNGKTTKYEYDYFNRLTAVVSPKNERTEYTYSALGQLLQIKDALGKVTTFTYDANGNMIQKVDPLGFVTARRYDASGNVIQETDPNGNVKSYTYNSSGKLISKTLPDNAFQFTYDTGKRLTGVSDWRTNIQFQYDVAGRLIGTTSSGLGALSSSYPAHSLTFQLDADGNRIALGSPYGDFQYAYDELNRLTQMTNPNSEVYAFTYDAASRLTSVSRPGSVSSFGYDSSGLLTSLSHSASSGGLLLSLAFTRDLQGNVLQLQMDTGTRTFGYDDNNQIVSATNPSSPKQNMSAESFQYDAISNRQADQLGQFTYDSASQRLMQDYRYIYLYDNNGNLITKQAKGLTGEVTNYSYSSENQLIGFKVYLPGSNSPVKSVTYTYDVMGRRITKDVIDYTAQNDPLKTFSRRYIYDGQAILAELDASQSVLALYTHNPQSKDDVLATNITSNGVTAKLAANSGSFQYLKDHQGSIAAVSDSNGRILQKTVYSTFGIILGVQDAMGADISSNPILNTSYSYTGREYDSESGYYYYRARYYDAQVGRFLQKDPEPGKLAEPSTVVNSYAYCRNNPVNLVDPDGRFGFLLAILYGAIYSAIVSAVQAAVETLIHGGNFFDHFGKDFAINFAFTAIGIGIAAFKSAHEFALGWGGVYTTDAGARGFSLGFFQNSPSGFGTQTYWHEIGHSINWAIGGVVAGPDWSNKLGFAGGWFAFHGLGSIGAVNPGDFNPFTLTGEGAADLWSSPWYHFAEVKDYPFIVPR